MKPSPPPPTAMMLPPTENSAAPFATGAISFAFFSCSPNAAQRDRGRRASDLSDQKNSSNAMRSGNSERNFTKPHCKSVARPLLLALLLASSYLCGKEDAFRDYGVTAHRLGIVVRPSTPLNSRHMVLASASSVKESHKTQERVGDDGQANPQSAVGRRTFMARFRVVLRGLLLKLHVVGSEDAELRTPIQSRVSCG